MNLTGLCYTDLNSGGIATWDQLGGTGRVENKALAIPGHLGEPWRSLERVFIHPVRGDVVSSVGIHRQRTDEIYFLYEGEGTLTTNGERSLVAAGDLVIAPKGTVHSISNLSHERMLRFLVVELEAPLDGYRPTLERALPRRLKANQGDESKPYLVAEVDLSQYFSGAWGSFSLQVLPPGGHLVHYQQAEDQNFLICQGKATINVADMQLETDERLFNIVVPRGLPCALSNASRTNLMLAHLSVHREREP